MNRSPSYNERLFSGHGLRSWLHNARFHWLRDTVRRLDLPAARVIELGCYDAKLLDWLPARPQRYLGIDANWEKGLDLARARHAGDPAVELVQATHPAQVAVADRAFDLGVSMETLEHVPPELLVPYLELLLRAVDGHVLLTVPNERGLVFASKWLAKRAFYGGAEPYTRAEFVAATLGRMDRVARNEHKGFDYAQVVARMRERADVVAVEAIPLRGLPLAAAFGVGIVARTRR